jgi:hypothetical protein
MRKATAITCVFLDIGGVPLTDGWGHHARKRTATNLKLPDVYQDRGRLEGSKHSSHGLQINVRKTGFVRIAE